MTTSPAFLFLGLYLILAGVAGYASNPEGAKTALISGGFFGGLCLLWSFLHRRGWKWVRPCGLATIGLLCAAFVWRASVGWLAVAGGQRDKLFAAALISSMLLMSLLAGWFVLRDRAK
jgi:uncharacterized membrane protein (UPF0136 family)